MRVAAVAALLIILALWGLAVDRAALLGQGWLFAALQVASLGGAALGVAWVARRFETLGARVALALGALVAWRVAYFPIMVFSGHVASIGEWLSLRMGLPVCVYPVFLVAVALLHVVAVVGMGWLFRPPRPVVYAALVPAFVMAAAVSFSGPQDLTWLPDRTWILEAPVPAARAERGNPYLPALARPGYAAQQRVMLAAAGATYATIPPSPWATTVKAVLEGLFEENPLGSTGDRVVEHYLAYHSAHRFIGCRDFEECPLPGSARASEEPDEVAESPGPLDAPVTP